MYHAPPHISVIKGNILITIIRFTHYHLLLASNTTVMTDSQSLGTIQICQNLNEHHHYLTSTKSVAFQKYANCSPDQLLNMLPFHIKLERLKLIYNPGHNILELYNILEQVQFTTNKTKLDT